MTYTVSITSQGQMSIPVSFRRQLGLDKKKKAVVSMEDNRIIVEPMVDFLELGGSLKTDKKIPFHKIREGFENYLAEEAIKGVE